MVLHENCEILIEVVAPVVDEQPVVEVEQPTA